MLAAALLTVENCQIQRKLGHYKALVFCSQLIPRTNKSSDCDVDNMDISMHISDPSSAILSQQQKYRKAFKVAQNLCQQLSTFGMCGFNKGIEVLQSLSNLARKFLLEKQV